MTARHSHLICAEQRYLHKHNYTQRILCLARPLCEGCTLFSIDSDTLEMGCAVNLGHRQTSLPVIFKAERRCEAQHIRNSRTLAAQGTRNPMVIMALNSCVLLSSCSMRRACSRLQPLQVGHNYSLLIRATFATLLQLKVEVVSAATQTWMVIRPKAGSARWVSWQRSMLLACSMAIPRV